MKTTTKSCYAPFNSSFTTQSKPQSEFVYVSTSIPSAIVMISTQYQSLFYKEKLELLKKLQEWIDDKQTEMELEEMKPEKLYTEEQVIKAYVIGNNHGLTGVFDCSIEELSLTSIELPSNEEIVNNACKNPIADDFMNDRQIGFVKGAKWMKEQILNQNK
jgi:hypothetical protein